MARCVRRAWCVLAFAASPLVAQQPAVAPRPIQDNSFLLEEAYNQEPAVVQHINNLFFDRRVSNWVYVLTDEWPVGGQRHQLSLTLPVQSAGSGTGGALGDMALNYRLQLVGSGDTRLALTPRVTLVLPTAAEELGGGTWAWQAALASSLAATPRLVLHSNAGVNVAPRAEAEPGASATLTDFIAGQSVVWLAHPRFNVLVEGVLTSAQRFTGIGAARVRETGITLSPGIRWAHDFVSGLQIVPGLAVPMGFRANDGQRGVFLYMSFEHEMPGLAR